MPSVSQKQRAFIFATKGEKFARAHHFDNKGQLPERSPRRKHKPSSRRAMYEKFLNRHG